ncbi:hypothetical protein Vretifemale_3368 [Volvox reticuliferus]|uniref:Uncharacterized protein n=1 Tax=Volvox reticuliferus TaxID=1737510 RepID=A0A8J4C4K9_9CHLO|nr:hypothetical protein Vretifemale_3368 [Volvox reticuliferus]
MEFRTVSTTGSLKSARCRIGPPCPAALQPPPQIPASALPPRPQPSAPASPTTRAPTPPPAPTPRLPQPSHRPPWRPPSLSADPLPSLQRTGTHRDSVEVSAAATTAIAAAATAAVAFAVPVAGTAVRP